MKEFILIRYANQPNPQVSQKLAEFVIPGSKPFFTTLPGVMITQFKSNNTIDEIKLGFDMMRLSYDLVEKQGTVNPEQSTTHNPNRPSKEQLERDLQNALNAEDFEKAAELRDKITQLYPATESFITNINDFKIMLENKKK